MGFFVSIASAVITFKAYVRVPKHWRFGVAFVGGALGLQLVIKVIEIFGS